MGLSSWVWNRSCVYMSLLSCPFLEWSPRETNLPTMQLHVKLAYGIAYGVTTRWLGSHSWEDARKKLAEETHLSLKRQLPNTQLSPCRLVLAKTTVLTEKNTAKKLTLGGMGEHRARYLHLFEVSFKLWKALLKIHSIVTRNVFSVSLRIVLRQEMHWKKILAHSYIVSFYT